MSAHRQVDVAFQTKEQHGQTRVQTGTARAAESDSARHLETIEPRHTETYYMLQVRPILFTTKPDPREVPTMWVVERLDIDGEELPILRHAETWLPAPIALRYALRTRFKLGPASLTYYLRAIAILYNWAESTEGIGDFEDFLTSGHVLSRDQLLTLIPYLLCRYHYYTDEWNNISSECLARPSFVSNQTFNTRLSAVRQFLKWAAEPTHHGGHASLSADELVLQRIMEETIFDDEKFWVKESPRQEPITVAEIKLIRKAIAPNIEGKFPPNVFTPNTRYRNWIMFETALNLGTRKGELLTLKINHLPGNKDENFFFIPRQQDAVEDPRKRRRLRGKTSERSVPLMEPKLLPSILGYRDTPPPLGRNSPKFKTPYLFVTKKGQPVSNSTAGYIIKQIGKYAAHLLDNDITLDEYTRARMKESLLALTWHRLRHTWAELAALSLHRKHDVGAWAILKEWGGWRSEESMQRYIENTLRAISDRAGREYLSSYTK